jgi:hypothetical protein
MEVAVMLLLTLLMIAGTLVALGICAGGGQRSSSEQLRDDADQLEAVSRPAALE